MPLKFGGQDDLADSLEDDPFGAGSATDTRGLIGAQVMPAFEPERPVADGALVCARMNRLLSKLVERGSDQAAMQLVPLDLYADRPVVAGPVDDI